MESFAWRFSSPQEETGIVVGSDRNQEWLLPWWWSRYRKHNRQPVVFIDFGMSPEMGEWCRQRGELVALQTSSDFVRNFDESLFAELKNTPFCKQFWDFRNAWFKKPFACLQTPFRKSLWLDLDCEVTGSLQPLFEGKERALSMAKDPNNETLYNSGVIAFSHGEELIVAWARHCFALNHAFRGDQEVFSHMLGKLGVTIRQLPSFYNWSPYAQERGRKALIIHWHGIRGKEMILKQIESE